MIYLQWCVHGCRVMDLRRKLMVICCIGQQVCGSEEAGGLRHACVDGQDN